jgi:hypothetical protein
MSEQPTAAPPRPPGRGAGKTYAGLNRNQWLIVGGVFVAALGYIVWRRRKAAAAAASSGGGVTNQGSNECTDANGNPVDCNEAFAQELAGLQNSLDQLGAQSGGGSSGGGGWAGSPGTTPAGTPDTTTGAPAVSQPSATPVTSTGTTAGTVRTAPKTAGGISNLQPSAVTKTSFRVSWQAASNATGGYAWVVRDLASHTQTAAGTTRSTSVTVSGLKSGTDYNFGVQALPGGAGDNIHVRTK